MNEHQVKSSIFKKAVDKLFRKITGRYEGDHRKEIDFLQESYSKFFGQLPEILNLGNDYENRIELSKASFKIDYWIDQLNGGFYKESERMIDIMCSYEMEKMKRIFNGYTDDPIHLFFYDLKQYAVKLSKTQFDIEDIKEAKNWQNFLRDLILNDVFKPGNEDTRQQVLFDLEILMRNAIIPKLEKGNENKAALDQLKSVSSHLTKFLDIAFKYMFYICRDSEYVANFSMRKLQLLISKNANETETLSFTKSEKAILDKIKNTWSLQLLYIIFAKDDVQISREHLALISTGDQLEIYEKNFSKSIISNNEIQKLLEPYYGELKKKNNDYFSHHIDLQSFINTLLLLGELSKFKELFDLAKACAEMGGNLLAFGLLRTELIKDIEDCSDFLNAVKFLCNSLENCAWEAFRKQSKGEVISNKWKDNYTKSAAFYFNSLIKSYEICQEALNNLAAAATKKSLNQLVEETTRVTKRYTNIHFSHASYRKNILKSINHISSMNEYLKKYHVQQTTVVPTLEFEKEDAKNDYKKFKKFIVTSNTNSNINYAELSASYYSLYSKKDDFTSCYYLGRFTMLFNNSENKSKEFFNKAYLKKPKDLKLLYRLAQIGYKSNDLKDALKYIETAIGNLNDMGLNDSKLSKKFMELQKLIEEKRESENKINNNLIKVIN